MTSDPARFRFPIALNSFLLLVYLTAAPCAWAQDDEAEPAPPPTDLPPNAAPQPTADLIGGGRIGPDYVIGPGDVLEVEVFNVPELKKTVRVSNDGAIGLPLLGNVKAAGLTVHQLRRELESAYGKSYLESPQITIFIREFHANPVSVIGAVEKPGLYQLTGPRNLIDVLSMAGGLLKRSSGAAGRTVYVTRKAGFGELQLVEGMRLVSSDQVEIDLKTLLYSHDKGVNIPIKPFDAVSVSKAGIVYVVGAVRKPGGFVLEDRESVTILQALAMAEGFQGSPAKGRARIVRTAQDGTRTEIPIDLRKVMDGKSQDVVMAANDILIVPDSTGKYAGKRGVEAAISTVSGLLIFGRL